MMSFLAKWGVYNLYCINSKNSLNIILRRVNGPTVVVTTQLDAHLGRFCIAVYITDAYPKNFIALSFYEMCAEIKMNITPTNLTCMVFAIKIDD